MRLSCALVPLPGVGPLAARAEQLGYSRVWLADSPALYGDVWIAVAECARATSRIGLGTSVLIPSLRHVVVTAAAIAHVEAIAPGRLRVAFGTGFTGRRMLGQRALPLRALGVGYLSENKVQQAFVEFQRAYELDPRNKEALNAIGIIYLLRFEETQMAADFFQKAIKVDPDYSEAYNNLGVAHEKMGKFDAAIPFYKKAVSNLLYSTPENAFINMGRAYYRLGKFNEAATAYKEAIKRAPSLDLSYLGLALCYNATGKYGDASAAMSRAISLNTVYKGDARLAAEDFNARRIVSSGFEQKDLSDFLEILKY